MPPNAAWDAWDAWDVRDAWESLARFWTNRRLLLGCALPLAASLGVLMYVLAIEGRWAETVFGSITYAACVVVLSISAAVSAEVVRSSDGRPGGGGRLSASLERFVDGAKSIADEVIMPRLDRLVLGLMGKNADGSQAGGGGLTDSNEDDPQVSIVPGRFTANAGGDAGVAASTVNEYAWISYLMCRIAESYPEDYRVLFHT
jgi:hypothetical protein